MVWQVFGADFVFSTILDFVIGILACTALLANAETGTSHWLKNIKSHTFAKSV
jgi:hypothetical protein